MIGVLALTSCGTRKTAPPDRIVPVELPVSVVDRFLSHDGRLLTTVNAAHAKKTVDAYVDGISSCYGIDAGLGDATACLLDRLLGPNGFRIAGSPRDPEANTASYVLANRRGSCAALVAAILMLTDERDAPFEAVVLREHVLLGLAAREGVYFEVLESGRELRDSDLSRYSMPPGGPVRLDASSYLPYYLDNLAARLAESGDDNKAEEFFNAAIGLDPAAPRLRYNFGTFLLEQRREQEALEQLDRTVELGWSDALTWVNRGVALWRLGRVKDARRSFETALELEPGNREALVNLRKIKSGASPVPTP